LRVLSVIEENELVSPGRQAVPPSLDTCDQVGRNIFPENEDNGLFVPAVNDTIVLSDRLKGGIEHEGIGQDKAVCQDSTCGCKTPGQVLSEKESYSPGCYRAGSEKIPAITSDGQSVLPWSFGATRTLPGFRKVEITAALVDSLKGCGRDSEAEAVEHCGQEFKVGQCTWCLSFPAFPLTCDNRLCPDCASRRAETTISEHHDILCQINHPKFITLTCLSVEHLTREFILKQVKYFTRLRHRKVWSKCWGGLRGTEFTYTPGVGWHMHFHIIVGSGYIDQALLSSEWEEISGAKIVDIRAIKGVDKWDGIREVIKYPAKVSSFVDNPELVNEFLVATKGLKLVCGFGALYRVRTRRHGAGKMVCPVCGHNEIDFAHGCGFYVSRARVKKVNHGWLWMQNKAPPIIGS